jgi:hypothetical protein
MGYKREDYYAEGLADAFAEQGIAATAEQIKAVAESVAGYAEHASQAFYTPSASDRIADIERGWQAKYNELKKDFEKYENNAETAVKKALRVHRDTSVSIGEYGEVLAHGGRTTQIQ